MHACMHVHACMHACMHGQQGSHTQSRVHMHVHARIVHCRHEEWFTRYMQPWRHFIPLSADASHNELSGLFRWVADNEHEVHMIAQNGQQFYRDYLSKERNEEHLWQLVHRLSQVVVKKREQLPLHRHPQPRRELHVLCDGRSFVSATTTVEQNANASHCLTKTPTRCWDTTAGSFGEKGEGEWTNRHGMGCAEYVLQGLCLDGRFESEPRCIDTPQWTNGRGMTCKSYQKLKYCTNGTIPQDKKWATGPKYQSPEDNCCACGAKPLTSKLNGSEFNFPERHCCGCGGGVHT